MDTVYHCYATAAFGLEGLVSGELKRLGACEVLAENGGVRFSASSVQMFSYNLQMHFCDRLYIILFSEMCTTFDQLFNLVHAVDWPFWFSGNESIDVTCKCTRSKLMSPRDCQSITKKAVIEKIKHVKGQTLFPESGPSLPIHLTIRNDIAALMLNMSGTALSRRGYRTWNGEAPLRETLAASLVELSGWQPGQPLHDPCCGTGTILIEAALIASRRAPGLNRSFAMENFTCFRNIGFNDIRTAFASRTDLSGIRMISGSDIDSETLELAGRHIRQAGILPGTIPLDQIPLQNLKLNADHGVFICNPPYGERLSDQNYCRELYHELNLLKQRHPTWRLCAITSDPAFERYYGGRAKKKRRLYNGRLECVFYIYD